MKKTLLALILILCLVLCGCTPAVSGDHSAPPAPSDTQQTPPPSAEPSEKPSHSDEPSVAPTEPPVFGDVVPGTDGTLRALPLNVGVYCDAYVWDNTILLYNDRTCQVRSLEDGSILQSGPGVAANQVTVTEDYMIYYLSNQKIVFRNRSLKTEKMVEVDVDVNVTDMLFSQDGSKAYYHVYPAKSIVELDIQTGQKREIPVNGPSIWTLCDLSLDTLCYWGKEGGQEYYAFVSLSSGKYLGKSATATKLQCWDSGYYLCSAEDGNIEHLVASGTNQYHIDLPEKENLHYSTYALPELNSLLSIGFEYERSEIILALYDFVTGECTASLTADLGTVYNNATTVLVDPSGEYIWLCVKTGTERNYKMVLYRWDYPANTIVQ